MPAGDASRPAESRAIDHFLTAAAAGPAALLIEGDPGIGKTTLWLTAVDQARERGFQVLSTRGAEAESVLAHSALADMLSALDTAAFAHLPPPQRLAVDRALLQVDSNATVTDPRAVGAAFLSVVIGLTVEAPVLLAIDDVQWLDSSSRQVVEFAARRLSGAVGLLGTVRSDPTRGRVAARLQLSNPDGMSWLRVDPLRVAALSKMVAERLGRSFSRTVMARIQEISGGNPFYALELARAIDSETIGDHVSVQAFETALPRTLSELVEARIGNLDAGVRDVLLAAACVAAPTVDFVARATRNDAGHVVELLEQAEAWGIVAIDGHRLRFTHPLLARGVYTDAGAARRRTMHRRLAGMVQEPELVARHLALAATTADPNTLQSLDAAAESARSRGAPAAAAEFVELAIGLGGDTPARRIRMASYYLSTGDAARARSQLTEIVDKLEPGAIRAEAASLLGVVHIFDSSFTAAAGVLERALDEAADDVELRTRLLNALSYARYNAGRFGAATQSIDDAVAHAEGLGHERLLSQALSMRVVLGFLRGDGLDEPRLARALALENRDADMPMAFRPRMQNAMLRSWTGQLDLAHHDLAAIRQRCVERGEENELIFVAVHSVLLEIWRGDFRAASVIADDTLERAQQLGGDVPLFVALTIRAALASYAGRENDTRRDTADALTASLRSGANLMAVWTLTTLGFLEVSLGNYEAALAAIGPLLTRLERAPRATEIVFAAFLPDAVEALVGLRRVLDAERLVTVLETNGARLGRPWMLAVGGRCRAMMLAAEGDVDAAIVAAEQAMAEHDRLPMPFERARTQLLLGQLQRRARRRDVATTTLREALSAFEAMGTPLWAHRAEAELARMSVNPNRTGDLTPSEHRVAELAASGMTNRDVATALFISPKTVEANLARVYRKLGIESRAELGSHMSVNR